MRRPLSKPVPAEAVDGLDRTDWLDPELDPTIPGPYECATGGLHIFTRTWTGVTWLSPITGIPSKVRMSWRGVKPGSVEITKYPAAVRPELQASLEAGTWPTDLIQRGHEQYAAEGKTAPSETHALAIGALYS